MLLDALKVSLRKPWRQAQVFLTETRGNWNHAFESAAHWFRNDWFSNELEKEHNRNDPYSAITWFAFLKMVEITAMKNRKKGILTVIYFLLLSLGANTPNGPASVSFLFADTTLFCSFFFSRKSMSFPYVKFLKQFACILLVIAYFEDSVGRSGGSFQLSLWTLVIVNSCYVENQQQIVTAKSGCHRLKKIVGWWRWLLQIGCGQEKRKSVSSSQ